MVTVKLVAAGDGDHAHPRAHGAALPGVRAAAVLGLLLQPLQGGAGGGAGQLPLHRHTHRHLPAHARHIPSEVRQKYNKIVDIFNMSPGQV